MILTDILTILLFIICFGLFSHGEIPIWMTLLFSLAAITPLAFILKWPKRFSKSRERSRLLKHRRHTVIGAFTEFHPYDTGKEKTVSVLDGYSQKAFSAEIYSHYHFEKQKIYDGTIAVFEKCDMENGQYYYNNQTITLRTLPKTFWGTEDELPPVDSIIKLVYVTSQDGTHYFVEAKNSINVLPNSHALRRF